MLMKTSIVISCLILSIFGATSYAADTEKAEIQSCDPIITAGHFFDLVAQGNDTAIKSEDLVSKELLIADFSVPSPKALIDKALTISEEMAVVRFHSPTNTRDYYLYLRRSSLCWQAEAIRSLALPRFVIELRDGLEAMPQRDNAQEAMLQNLSLTMQSDFELKKWFTLNIAALNKMRSLRPKFDRFDDHRRRTDQPNSDAIVDQLHLNNAEIKGEVFEVSVGGILDNSVGFLHAVGSDVPKISASEYIWIEPLGDDWYLYRTT